MQLAGRSLLLIGISAATLAAATPAHAVPDTFVAGGGSDAGNCPISAPCATFAFAVTRTNPNGTVHVLRPGSYGPFAINKSLNIVAEGVLALIESAVVCPGNTGISAAICIFAGADGVVNLRGLIINQHGATGGTGIFIRTGAEINLENIEIGNGGPGINYAPATSGQLVVTNSTITDSNPGISVKPISGFDAKIALERVQVFRGGAAGVKFDGEGGTGLLNATIHDSVFAGNGVGVHAVKTNATGSLDVMMDNTASSHNLVGVFVRGAKATVRMGDSTVSSNVSGLFHEVSGKLLSYGDNKVNGNGLGDGTPTGPVAFK